MRLVGEDTRLDVSGTVGLADRQVALHATGDANLGILQGFFRDIRSAGQADLVADVKGTLDQPVLTGQRVDRRRSAAPLRVAPLARRGERADHVRRRRRPPRRPHRPARRRARPVRRPPRPLGSGRRRVQPDGVGRGHAPALPRRVPLAGQRRPRAARAFRRAAAQRRAADQELGAVAPLRGRPATSSSSPAVRRRSPRRRRRATSRCGSTSASSRRRRCGSTTTWRGSCRAPT